MFVYSVKCACKRGGGEGIEKAHHSTHFAFFPQIDFVRTYVSRRNSKRKDGKKEACKKTSLISRDTHTHIETMARQTQAPIIAMAAMLSAAVSSVANAQPPPTL